MDDNLDRNLIKMDERIKKIEEYLFPDGGGDRSSKILKIEDSFEKIREEINTLTSHVLENEKKFTKVNTDIDTLREKIVDDEKNFKEALKVMAKLNSDMYAIKKDMEELKNSRGQIAIARL